MCVGRLVETEVALHTHMPQQKPAQWHRVRSTGALVRLGQDLTSPEVCVLEPGTIVRETRNPNQRRLFIRTSCCGTEGWVTKKFTAEHTGVFRAGVNGALVRVGPSLESNECFSLRRNEALLLIAERVEVEYIIEGRYYTGWVSLDLLQLP